MIRMPKGSKTRRHRDLWAALLPGVVILVAVVWIAYQFVEPAPPKRIVMSGGSEGGAYEGYAQRYKEILAEDKIEVVLRPSAGSVENLKRLMDGNSGVIASFVQGGIAKEGDDDELMSLASLYYEPLWVFYTGERTIDQVAQLRGRRIAIGPEGSGTRPLALRVLALAGVNAKNTRLLDLAPTPPPLRSQKGRSMPRCWSPTPTPRPCRSCCTSGA